MKKYTNVQSVFIIGATVLLWMLLIFIFQLRLDVFGTYVALFSVALCAVSQILIIKKILLNTEINFSYKIALETATVLFIVIQGILLFFYLTFVVKIKELGIINVFFGKLPLKPHLLNLIKTQVGWLFKFYDFYWWLVLSVTLLYGAVIYTLSRIGVIVRFEEKIEQHTRISISRIQMEINALADSCKKVASSFPDKDKMILLDTVDKLVNKGRSLRKIGNQKEMLQMEKDLMRKIIDARVLAEKKEKSDELIPLIMQVFSTLVNYSMMQIK